MSSKSHIRKNDTVVAISGVSAGSTGKVLQVLPSGLRVIVEGLNMIKKTVRKSQDNPQGGIAEKEGSISISNLMPYCPDCKKGVRLQHGRKDSERVRKCRACGHAFDN